MSMLMGSTTGLERVAREAALILADQLDAEIAEQETAWADSDSELSIALGQPYQVIELERISRSNIFLGHRPSILEGDIDLFPNLAVYGTNGRPGENNDNDFYHGYTVQAEVELFVKSGPYDQKARDQVSGGEDLVNRRIQRTTDAVVAVMVRNGSLNGLVSPMSVPPVVEISGVFVKRQDSALADTPVYFFQGSRIVLTYNKMISLG